MQLKSQLLEIRKLLPIALLLVSAAIIAFPHYRIESAVRLHRVLMTLECFWVVGWAMRNRYLSKTFGETVDAVGAAAPVRRPPILDQAAAAAGFVAMAVLAF